MGLFGKKVVKNAPPQSEPYFYPLNINGLQTIGKPQTPTAYFIAVPELYAIVSTKANMFSKMSLAVVNKRTGEREKLTNHLARLIQNPNYHQGQKEFIKQTKVFRELYGNEYLLPTKPIGMDIRAINTLDPANITISTTDKSPVFLKTSETGRLYTYTFNGQNYQFTYDEIIHIGDPSITNSEDGQSRITPLKAPLNNIIGAYQSRGMIIHNRGAIGILSNAAKDGIGAVASMDKREKELLQNEFRKYGLAEGQSHTIITNLSLNWQKIGGNVKDLMLYEEIEADFQTLLSAYGLRRELFPSLTGATFENQKQAEKAAYTNTIIPEAEEWISALNNYFETENKAYEIRGDFSKLDIFSDDKSMKANALSTYVTALSQAFRDGAIDIEEYKIRLNDML